MLNDVTVVSLILFEFIWNGTSARTGHLVHKLYILL